MAEYLKVLIHRWFADADISWDSPLGCLKTSEVPAVTKDRSATAIGGKGGEIRG
jgi:hypothetical protein